MRTQLVYLLAFISIAIGLFHYREIPGCEKSKQPPNTTIESCCPSLPHYSNRELFVFCNQTCAMWLFNPHAEGSRKCCLLNCTYVEEHVMERYGAFAPDKMIALMKRNLTAFNASWSDTITSVVNDCTKKGMALSLDEIHFMDVQCETENITIALNVTQCIRREMFFACKDSNMKHSRCQSLVEYGKGCSYWPWQCNYKRVHTGNVRFKPKPPGIP